MSNSPTYDQIASDIDLWYQYIDPDRHTTQLDWDNMSHEDKVKFIVDCFGYEK